MATLNRFPLLGLWAKGAARRLGYTRDEARALGHAYAVLYAIRARGKPRPDERPAEPPRAERKTSATEELAFAGDRLDVVRDAEGRVRGRVGGAAPQTAASYAAAVARKFPPGYYEKLEEAFRRVLKAYPPRKVNSRLVYRLYDEWKKACGVGRLVDLDALLRWCHNHAATPAGDRRAVRSRNGR